MTSESQLINKSYYQTILDESKKGHPIKVLGEMFIEEMEGQRPELSSIRFAQGEVYFLNQDYESAIYKWQHPLNKQLIPWAQKNIADAHFEMGLLEDAERFYHGVVTESVVLKSEVLLQLFSMYIQQHKSGKAVDTIKQAVQLNPDYAHVTELARSYFEDMKDWNSAIELAVNEAIRTNALLWFEILEGYAEQGLTSTLEPNYFSDVLETIFHMDKYRFEILTEKLWISYTNSTFYLQWLEGINQLLLKQGVELDYKWKKLPSLFNDTYVELISGRYLIQDISQLIHLHLSNWLEISSDSDGFIPSTAIIAWDEMFPSELPNTLIQHAEKMFVDAKPEQNDRQDGVVIFDSIKAWAKKEGLLEDLSEYILPLFADYNIESASPSKIRDIISVSLEFLMEQRGELEHAILEEMKWKEELLARVNDMLQQTDSMEKEKAIIMTESFIGKKQNFIQNVMSDIPRLLRNCSELVQEDSDYTKLHIEINEEMNRRIADYIKNTSLPFIKQSISWWIEDCEGAFKEIQIAFDEWSKEFNQQYNEEKMVLQGDFKILDDWQRDMERIARGWMRLGKVNILLRNNPSQLLLKSAGKFFGSISKNKEMLYSKYKSYIETADYNPIVEDILRPFLQQLELFEESIEWDSSRFSSDALHVLNSVCKELKHDMDKQEKSLHTMRERPELYRDPLTLFELRLRQYELVHTIE